MMRVSVLPMLLFPVLCAFILLLLLNFSVMYDKLLIFSYTSILRYSVFNGIIFAILVRSSGSSGGGVVELLPCLQFSDGISEQIEDIGYASEDSETDGSNDYDSHSGSSGYEEDNDDNHSDGDIDSVEDDEETDHDLENRVEAFISKVIQGWKEELMTEKMSGIDL